MTDTAVRKHDGLNWHAFGHVDKYSLDQAAYAERKVAESISWFRHPGLARQQRRGTGSAYQGLLNKALRAAGDPEDGYAEADGNLLVNGGLTAITGLVAFTTSASGHAFGPTADAGCGVGSTTTAATVTDTVLGANTTAPNGTVGCWYQGLDASFPTTSAGPGIITAQATFASGNANMAWQEWCWFSTAGAITPGSTLASVATTPVMWNHKIASLGTKASGAAWVFTTTITLS